MTGQSIAAPAEELCEYWREAKSRRCWLWKKWRAIEFLCCEELQFAPTELRGEPAKRFYARRSRELELPAFFYD